MNLEDTRNVMDEFKGMHHDEIVQRLDERGSTVEIAIENTLRDYNMGTIVRTANAFGIRTVHVIGRKQWNKRGAMMTDKYLAVRYHSDVREFVDALKQHGKRLVAVDNVPGSVELGKLTPAANDVLVFGQEGPGVSDELLQACDNIVHIAQQGSTRSLNVGVAAGIAMHRWSNKEKLL